MRICDEKKKKNIVMILAGLACTAALFLVVYISGIHRYMREAEQIPLRLVVTGFAVLVAELVFIVIARVKMLVSALRGYFLFKLVGCIAFVVCLFVRMGGSDINGTFFGYIYNVWTVTLRPLSNLISPFVGVSEFLRKALLLIIITYVAGSAFLGIKKQEKFESELQERKSMESSL